MILTAKSNFVRNPARPWNPGAKLNAWGQDMANKIKLGNLTIDITQSNDVVTYVFRGDVDEHFRHQEVPRIQAARIVFDLAEVQNFNSCGIREWIHFVKEICEQGKVIFRRCSVTMVDQINMVPHSLGKAKIESFYAPYYRNCECYDDAEVNCLIDVEQSQTLITQSKAPEFKCDSCGEAFEFDALEESYFLFVGNALEQAS